MYEIFAPVIIVSVIGIIAGLILSIFSVIMNVKKNEKLEKILEILPGVNCGACGFSGCEGYAKALISGHSQSGLCLPGGIEINSKIGLILGKKSTKRTPKIAIIKCNGTCKTTAKKIDYNGIETCTALTQLCSSDKNCTYGCIGLGDCKKACQSGAITIVQDIAHIDPNKCIGCGKCLKVCPKGLICLIEAHNQAYVNCSNLDKGIAVKKACAVGCLGCKLCEKACKFDAIHIKNNLALINSQKCTACGECQKICPSGCINIITYS